MSEPFGVFSVAAPAAAANNISFLCLTVIFHYITLDAAVFRIGVTSYSGSLKPECGMPAVIFRKLTPAFVISEFVHKFRIFKFTERPKALTVLGQIINHRSGLKLSRKVIVAFFDHSHMKIALAVNINSFTGKCRRFFPPEIFSEAPLVLVKLIAVKFIVPNQFPLFMLGQKA